jgi:hypothetical protein
MRYAAIGGILSGGANLSRPFAILEIRGDEIRVSPRGPMKRGPLGISSGLLPVSISFSAITKVETDFGMSKKGIRFRVDGPGDGTVFWPSRRTRSDLIAALRTAGLNIK